MTYDLKIELKKNNWLATHLLAFKTKTASNLQLIVKRLLVSPSDTRTLLDTNLLAISNISFVTRKKIRDANYKSKRHFRFFSLLARVSINSGFRRSAAACRSRLLVGPLTAVCLDFRNENKDINKKKKANSTTTTTKFFNSRTARFLMPRTLEIAFPSFKMLPSASSLEQHF